MSRLLETIKCKDGKLYNLKYHQARFDRARKLYFQCQNRINLKEAITVPATYAKGLVRCRVIYAEEIEKIEFSFHKYRTIKRLKLITDNSIEYSYKFQNRRHLNELYYQKGEADDIIIVKNGFITDSFAANALFYDGQTWWTPDTPLLPGTQRMRLLNEGKIKECRITYLDLYKYQKAGLINALQDLDNMPLIPMNNISP